MNWQDVCADPLLRDLPYKIELNRFGQIVMSPASNQHGRYQVRIAAELLKLLEGEVISECSVETQDGVKVADVAWCSPEFVQNHGLVTPFPAAPEICVEIVSPSNSPEELREKTALYFQAGTQEVWLCDESGNIEFFLPNQAVAQSRIAPAFPSQV